MTRPPFTPEERAGIARALEAAKSQLWDGTMVPGPDISGKAVYLCQAVEKAMRWIVNRVEFGYYSMAKEQVIQPRLHPHSSLDTWLHARGISNNSHDGTGNYLLLQAHRLAWLNQLIEEFSTPETEAAQ